MGEVLDVALLDGGNVTRQSARLGAWVACSLVLTGCPVDSRVLRKDDGTGGRPHGSGGGAGTFEGGDTGVDAGAGGTNAGSGGTNDDPGGTGGTAGSNAGNANAGSSAGVDCPCTGGSAGGQTASACPDLDGNSIPDCDETLVKNAAFDSGVDGWFEEPGLVLAWEQADAAGRETSGALAVENRSMADRDGSFVTAARQCIPVTGGEIYQFAAQVNVPEDQGEGTGIVFVAFFDDETCTGALINNATSNPIVGAGWKVTTLTHRTPATSKSALVRLGAVKEFRQPALKVLFDNVLARKE